MTMTTGDDDGSCPRRAGNSPTSTNLAFADRAFSHAAPAVWNSLPPDTVSDLSCLATFKRLVKTELYNRAYLR